VGVLVVCVLVFTVFCIVCTVFLYCFIYVYSFLFVLFVLVKDYCHRVTTQLHLLLLLLLILIIIIIIIISSSSSISHNIYKLIFLIAKVYHTRQCVSIVCPHTHCQHHQLPAFVVVEGISFSKMTASLSALRRSSFTALPRAASTVVGSLSSRGFVTSRLFLRKSEDIKRSSVI